MVNYSSIHLNGKMKDTDLFELTEAGLYCRIGNFHIDPWKPVPKAIVTHGHSDHAIWGCGKYLSSETGVKILQQRLGFDIELQTLKYGEKLYLNGMTISLHPAGHILGSAQVCLDYRGNLCVVSGDYKVEPDPTCTAFETIRCHTFITESTFGLPIFRWQPQKEILEDINAWWKNNREQKKTSILFAYALGKAQRVISGLDPSIGPILTHGAVEKFNRCYRDAGVSLPLTRYVGEVKDKKTFESAIVIAPPSADTPLWTKKFPQIARAFASGWMQIRGNRRRRSVDCGFTFSDHSDWDDLIRTIWATGAERIWVTHGYASELARWIQEHGLEAMAIPTQFSGEIDDAQD